jgi:hypothetical protein
MVAILKYFEGLEILTPEIPRGSRLMQTPLLGRAYPAYWRIEGKAVMLYRALRDQEPGKSKSPKEGTRRRGRAGDTDPKADQKIWDAWKTGQHKDYADLARYLEVSEKEVARAIDRHRHRLARASAKRRTNSPDK